MQGFFFVFRSQGRPLPRLSFVRRMYFCFVWHARARHYFSPVCLCGHSALTVCLFVRSRMLLNLIARLHFVQGLFSSVTGVPAAAFELRLSCVFVIHWCETRARHSLSAILFVRSLVPFEFYFSTSFCAEIMHAQIYSSPARLNSLFSTTRLNLFSICTHKFILHLHA